MTTKRKAFTLIEALLALAVVALAIVALLRLHLISLKTLDYTQTANHASLLAQQKMEECLAQPFPPLGTRKGRQTSTGHELHWTTTVTPADLSINQQCPTPDHHPPLRRVHVRVAWKQGHAEKHLDLDTCVANTSPQTQVVTNETL